jgi:formylglycine-generating enzyme required for sulfatase activity
VWRRLIISASILLFLVLVLASLWSGFDWPPPRLILKYGFAPTGGPTGRTMTIEGVEFVELKPGYFLMGSHYSYDEGNLLGRLCAALGVPFGEHPHRDERAVPLHWVEVRAPFWISRYEITNAAYERFDASYRREYSDSPASGPATAISWFRARSFCEWLSGQGALSARLPSEAEWEYACRSGTTTEWCSGDDETMLGEYAWFSSNAGADFRPVGTRRANDWGLFDMHGNVSEWCEDTMHEDYLGAPSTSEAWVDESTPFRVHRGGSVTLPAAYCRSAERGSQNPKDDFHVFGFRVAGELRGDDVRVRLSPQK